MPSPAKTPKPPYYAVIFTSVRTAQDDQEYGDTARRMVELAEQQPGFLGFETARGEIGISVSYWSSLDAIRAWKEHAQHREAQQRATHWYREFRVRICRVEKEHGF